MPLAVRTPKYRPVIESAGGYRRMLNVLDRKQTAVQRQLRRAGLAGYEPLTLSTLLSVAERMPPGGAVLDIGAHIGLYAALIELIFGAKNPSVHAFEPAPETAEICRRLRDANDLGFDVWQVALGNSSGEAELHLSEKAETSNSLNPGFRRHERSVTVPVTTLDAFTAEHDVWPYLVKIDVETWEWAVLEGAMETFARSRPWIVCEFLPNANLEAVVPLLRRLRELGYHPYLIDLESPWTAVEADAFADQVCRHRRDWLIAPEPVDADFHARRLRWLRAILACDEATNEVVPGGTPLPPGWRGSYRLT